ncbi:MAG: hypothetical protein AB1521_17685, partial [Bacteroidota bacterium]
MKKLLVLLIIIAGFVFAQNPEVVLNKEHKIDTAKVLVPDQGYERINQVITQLLSSYHYRKQNLSDS